MKERKIEQYQLCSQQTDGAGVKVNRIFWRGNSLDMDPFLLFDMFDSRDPNEYVRGFPFHPHRGIQTLTYMIKGEVIHRDSLGNRGVIRSGEFQWMNAGSGIFHEEMPQATEHWLGFQLWINLPRQHKMSQPTYLQGNRETIPIIEEKGYRLHLLSGQFGAVSSQNIPRFFPLQIYDIELESNFTLTIPVEAGYNVMVVTLQGQIEVAGQRMAEKSAVTLVEGDTVFLHSLDRPARVFLLAGAPLREPIAWGGPIVMNTKKELQDAQRDLKNGTFIREVIQL